MLSLNLCNTLELSGLFFCQGGLSKFFSAWEDRKNCWVLVSYGDQYPDWHYVSKAHPISVISVVFIMNNFAELQLLPTMEFSFNTLPRSFSIASLLKCVKNFTIDVFLSEKDLFSWTYLLKKTPRRTKILISLVWNKILKIWNTLLSSYK